MHTFWTILVIILIILIAVFAFLYFQGQKLQVRQAEAQKSIDMYSQTLPLLIIDKKKMKLKEAPLPKEVYEKTPAYMRFSSVYIVKAKVGPKIMNFMCEKNIFDLAPLKATVTAKVSGIYITEIVRGGVPTEKMIEKKHKDKAKAEKQAAKEAAKAKK